MEQSSFFNSVAGDRQYDAETFALYFKQFLSSGIIHTDNVPGLQVLGVGGHQTVLKPGSAFIEGYMYNNTSDIILDHDIADPTNPRIDRVVLRLDRSVNARNIKVVVKKGTPATNPQPPALQRDNIIYEISLYRTQTNAGSAYINFGWDERFDQSVAGLVSSLITIPTSQFQQQWEEWFNARQNEAGLKLTMGSVDPAGPDIAAGDVWFKEL